MLLVSLLQLVVGLILLGIYEGYKARAWLRVLQAAPSRADQLSDPSPASTSSAPRAQQLQGSALTPPADAIHGVLQTRPRRRRQCCF